MTDPGYSGQNGHSESHPTLAIAKFAFNGKNNDELTFTKNDVIMITQQLDGGWWEGTLSGVTGWFPSNYVTVLSDKEKLSRSRSVPSTEVAEEHLQQQHFESFVPITANRTQFRKQVLEDFLKNEQDYLLRLRKTVDEYLKPLKQAEIMPDEDYDTLCGNIEQILHFQTDVMHKINLTLDDEVIKQRIGGVLINSAPPLKDMLMAYCENHPRAVEVMNEKEESLKLFVETIGGKYNELVMGLSETFIHLGKYPISLQELERSMPDSHVDRGDVQRSCAVYKEMKYECDAMRKQKEMQLEFLAAGQIEQWSSFHERGRIKHLALADVERVGEDAEPRFVALFANTMLILEVTAEQNNYKLVEKYKLEGQKVQRVDGRYAVAFGSEVPIILSSASHFEMDRWLTAFAQCNGVTVEEASTSFATSPVRYNVQNLSSISTPRQPEVTMVPTPEYARIAKKPSLGANEIKLNHELEMVVPEGDDEGNEVMRGYKETQRIHNGYSGACLRPYPPIRGPNYAIDYGKKPVKMRNKETNIQSSEDAILLRIVEGYWQGGKAAAPSYEQAPQLIVAEDEKILVEELIDGQLVFQEKSLVDTVYALKDQVNSLQQKMDQLMSTVEKEQRARRRLEDMWRRGSEHWNLSNINSTPRTETSFLSENQMQA
ncbi:unnamed protein product, partial [Mesorhabditis belari]|uniref:Rho guanine nucleotide exchange factor 7 n=1 Tax=Mesorhabditis belari TaxID=2138241 RepID=A0AAF3FJ52_9BILA